MKQLRSIMMLLCLITAGATAQTYKQVNDISYTKKTDTYSVERLKLDVYYPEDMKDCPVMVWFHGGGLEAGNKEIPRQLKNKGYVVVGANYPETNARKSLPLTPPKRRGTRKRMSNIAHPLLGLRSVIRTFGCSHLFVPLASPKVLSLENEKKSKLSFCSFIRTLATPKLLRLGKKRNEFLCFALNFSYLCTHE